MRIASISIEPWSSLYMAFAWPGLLIWVIAAVWWFRHRDRFLPLAVQVVGAFEIVAGLVGARAFRILESEEMFVSSGQWDPGSLTLHDALVAEVVLLGVACHAVLMVLTGVMTVVTALRRRKRASSSIESEA